ncbi:MAG: GTP cyclohydrolase I FolE2 [Planctomyces sp.]|nr:GTP cyclohydrolase I FolE2 [Planctomyces sp.]MBA4120214.1 GTP cyclohydrolase I FolE2 [Isosphaera sp.]
MGKRTGPVRSGRAGRSEGRGGGRGGVGVNGAHAGPVLAAPLPPGVTIPDVQGEQDTRAVAIDKVGVKDVVYPMRLAVSPRHGGGEQATVARINMYVSLPHYQKGTHMSRFLEVLNAYDGAVSPGDIPRITESVRQRLGAAEAHLEASFTYFVRKRAPATGQPGVVDYQGSFACSVGSGTEDLVMTVRAPATSLCPCSKQISRYGAHNQRCVIEAAVRPDPRAGVLWIEDLIEILESAASEQVYAVLKRQDEKHVTERAFDNPKFVEDIVRDLALALDGEERVRWYAISSENFESIHNHNAYAQLCRSKPAGGRRTRRSGNAAR